MKKTIKYLIKRLYYSFKTCAEGNLLKRATGIGNPAQFHSYPGHFYSPIPSIEEIRLNEDSIFNSFSEDIPGINLNIDTQINLLQEFKDFYEELPFDANKKDNLRYFFENPNFSYADAIILYSMIRLNKPKKIIEIGAGFSSCVILDTMELFFNNDISYSVIEPYPRLFTALTKKEDRKTIEIVEDKLQNIPVNRFSDLSAGDILFIDSSHVSKINSDINRIFFEILPILKSGVNIHFHDIFYPFEYPKEWIYEGRAWNEAYLLRAFLQYNKDFRIQFFNDFIGKFHENLIRKEMPLCLINKGGSIWIKKIK